VRETKSNEAAAGISGQVAGRGNNSLRKTRVSRGAAIAKRTRFGATSVTTTVMSSPS